MHKSDKLNLKKKTPPIAKRVEHKQLIHGIELVDHYHWLRDNNWPNVNDKEILDYLNDENEYFHHVMDDSKELVRKLFGELKGRIKEEDSTVPYLDNGYYYYSYIKKGEEYWTHVRKSSTIDSKEEELLNENSLAKDKSYFQLGDIAISPDHKLIAYSIDTNGNERYKIMIKDIGSGVLLTETIENVMRGSLTWHENGKGLFYVPANEFWRSEKVYYHELGTEQTRDKLLFHETDNTFSVNIKKTESRSFILITSESKNSNEIRFIDCSKPYLELALIAPRRNDHLYYITHNQDSFYILTNNNGKNFSLAKTSITLTDEYNWQKLIEHSETEYLTDITMYENYLVISSKVKGLPKIKVFNLDKFYLDSEITFPDAAYEAKVQFTTFEADSVRYEYSSLSTVKSVIEYNFITKTPKTLKQQEIPSGFNAEEYLVERLYAKSEDDGVEIPISLIYKKSLFNDDSPLLLYGYGSYGFSVPASFRSSIFSLVDRGFVYAIAHIRGGDDLGFTWYESAKFLQKKNTFKDFITVAEFLVNKKYVKTGNIAIHGGSAGGMLMGACVNMRPELFKAVIADVPFVDVLNTMLDSDLPLTPGEFKEWGNPQEIDFFNYIKSYSPYDNVISQNYPHMLVTAGLNDPRVTYWEAAKWVAKLRNIKKDNNLLLLKINMEAGHQGKSGRFSFLEEIAEYQAFLLKVFEKNN